MPKSPTEMMTAIIANLLAKTGKTLAEWMALVPPGGKKARVAFLKAQGLGTVTAQIIVGKFDGSLDEYEDLDALVDAQYAGDKTHLRPLYDQIVVLAQKLGPDVFVKPCKTYVSFTRRSQFAVVKATTKTRLDFGLALPGLEPDLLPAKNLGGGDAITHRIEVSTAKDINAAAKRWLAAAYERNLTRK